MFRLVIVVFSILSLSLVSGEVDTKDRVVNGRTSSINEHPFVVSIQLNGRHFCGGSILNEKWILTAAHCMKDVVDQRQFSAVMVRAGSSTWTSGGTLKPIETATYHEKYNAMNMMYDIALIRILGSYIYSASIKPVRLVSAPVPSGRAVEVTGWGQLSDRNTNLPTVLQDVVMSYLGPAECQRFHGPRLLDTMICAVAPGKDACRGDSGGPLVMEKTNTQVGVVSWGVSCADAGLPGVYVDLTHGAIRAYIQRYVGKLP